MRATQLNKNTGPMDWNALLCRLVHPTQVAIIEAFEWINRPLSATELEKLFGGEVGLSSISYHLKRLKRLGVLELIGARAVRGASERFYFFAAN
jgi:DNA-binding transcriptional ArsR family regulator